MMSHDENLLKNFMVPGYHNMTSKRLGRREIPYAFVTPFLQLLVTNIQLASSPRFNIIITGYDENIVSNQCSHTHT